MEIFAKDRPRFTVNMVVVAICIVEAITLFMATVFVGFSPIDFFGTGTPNPSVCGPLLTIWAILCVLYITGNLKSPVISTIFAAVCVYFGTATLPFFRSGNMVEYAWATSVHALEAYIGYGYFIESAVRKYKLL